MCCFGLNHKSKVVFMSKITSAKKNIGIFLFYSFITNFILYNKVAQVCREIEVINKMF